jgi:crotonobetainyl-CoA:carnitine CoA-transferase CaiB-like acyl-CoA transferase
MALSAIAMALLHKERTGKGQYIDVSMMDGAITWLYAAVSDYFASDEIPKRGKNRLDGKFLSVGAAEKKFRKEL